MRQAVDLTGRRFGYLTVLRRAGSTAGVNKRALWDVRCVCGKEYQAIGQNLRNPNRPGVKSCGCRHGETILNVTGSHGMTKTRQYTVWINMRSRCRNPRDKDYPNYGGRGIEVCDKWYDSFDKFWEDMGGGYQSHLMIERVDNNGHYCKENCRWGTQNRQSNNKRDSHYINTPLGKMTVTQAARRYGFKDVTLFARIRNGWSEEELLLPTGSKRHTT